MKHVMTKTALAIALAAATAAAQAEFSANVAMTTDYVWRGVSQSDEDPAIQGGFDFSHESGFYAGVWASNVDFDEVGVQDDADMEFDGYLGISGEFSNGLGWDVGVIRYAYPGSTANLDWTEVYGSLSYAFNDTFSANAYLGHSGKYLANAASEDGTYFNVGVDIALPQEFGLSLSVGHTNIDNQTAVGWESYNDYKIGLTKSLQGFDFELAYTDTSSIGTNNWRSPIDNAEWADGRVVLTVGKTF